VRVRIGIGLAVIWAGYTLGIWGYCLVKAYDVPFPALFKSTWPGAQVSQTAPASGRQLGTITGNAQITGPAAGQGVAG